MRDEAAFESKQAVIKVVGVGGGGCNAINRMIEAGLDGVEFVAMNTDAQVLVNSKAPTRLLLGRLGGRGAGADPAKGERAAEDSREDIHGVLQGADMVFVTAGMGGGTGTGAGPIVAEISRELGALTTAVVTLPFEFEGGRKAKIAESGIAKLREHVDTLIPIRNQRLLQLVGKDVTLEESFRLADEVLRQGVKGITEMIVVTGLINTDFEDVKAIMTDGGNAFMAVGRASGEERALAAASQATQSPLLDTSIKGATGVLWNVKAASTIRLAEINEAAEIIAESAAPEANIIFGTIYDEAMGADLEITLLATGIEGDFGGFMPTVLEPLERKPEREAVRRQRMERPSASESAEEPVKPGPRSAPRKQTSFDNDDLDIPTFLRKRSS